jgi:hypothetical protein
VTLHAPDASIAPRGDDERVTASDAPSATPRPSGPAVPADPAAYDSERSAAARARGLAAPYIPGGRDPDQARAESEDRRYLRLLLIMVVVIVLAGFVLGFIAALTGMTGLVGNPG